jgi:hypothetical protein
MRAQINTNASVVDVFAKEFAKFLNRVQNQHADMLGSFLIDSEWEQYKADVYRGTVMRQAAAPVTLPI